ncbi:MAG: hypothetical protein OXI41_09500 [Chloroflexota bacterium]|nr:hypothetical protein [Chloroflexota bacterium]
MRRASAWWLALALTVILTIPAAPPWHPSIQASGDPPPGPCESGYVAPTPVLVAVSELPIVVSSTAADYFVLYVERPNPNNPRRWIPVSVTRGQAGTTTLTDNLDALSPDKYRVEQYQVAQPGDLDGDCVDDITELDDLGAQNPINPTRTTTDVTVRAALESRQAFQELSSQRDVDNSDYEPLSGLEYVMFLILGEFESNPSIYFMDSNDPKWHAALLEELRQLGEPERHLLVAMRGNLVYHPNVIAPDGSLGMYRFSYSLGTGGFSRTANLYQLLASAMPLLENNLAYYPRSEQGLLHYRREQAQYDASRVNILLQEDILPDVDYMPLNQAEGYGRLRLMAAGDEPRPGDIPIYESLPNDLPRVAGSITTVPQTPLSHVNLRAIQNGVPNAFLRDILTTKQYADLIGKHVYFAVAADGFTLREATKAEVDAHHAKSRPTATQTLTRDLSVTAITPLANVSFADWDAFGVKAANMAELSKLNLPAGVVPTGYAVPFYFYDEFMKANGFYDEIETMLADPSFQSDYAVQESMLKALRKKIKKGTTPAWMIKALEDMHAAYPEGTSLRYRSSTNNEDLPAFNGAGLYSSKTQDPDETADEGIDKSIKAVWASLWNYRAFLERDYYRVDHKSVAMGVLVHPNYSDEKANGVAVSHDPISFSPNAYYVNTQIGEDLVTNPEARSYPEQLLLDANGKASVLTRSNHAPAGQLLMSDAQMRQLRRHLEVIHHRFRQLYQVKDGERFAIEIEFKITAANQLAIKQARPWVFAETLSLTPTVSLAFAEETVTEGAPLTLVLSRRGGDRSKPLDIQLEWTDPDGKIQGTAPTSAQFPAAQAALSLSLPTVLTAQVEPESTITARITANSAYVLGDPSAASVTVTDQAGTSELSITAGPDVTEGEEAVFTLTADPAPITPLAVLLTVSGDEDYIYDRDLGQRTAIIPSGVTTVTLRIGTSVDSLDEAADGRVVATLDTPLADAGYSVSDTASSASITVADDDNGEGLAYTASPSVVAAVRALAAQTQHGSVHVNRWQRVLVAFGEHDGTGVTGGAMTAAEAQQMADRHSSPVWDQVVAELEQIESGTVKPVTIYLLLYAVQLTEGGPLSGGPGAAGRTKLAIGLSRELLAGETLVVPFKVDGDADAWRLSDPNDPNDPNASFGAQSSITFSDSDGFLTLLDLTAEDDADADDETITFDFDSARPPTLNGNTAGVTLGTNSGFDGVETTATRLIIIDDDQPPPPTPEVNITSAADGSEGGNVSFTLTATPAPAADLPVTVTISVSGDYGVTAGSRTVTIPASGSATLTLATTDDQTDEPDGSVTATLATGSGYTIGSLSAQTAAVADNDDPPVPELVVTPVVSITGGSAITEGGSASFTISANPSPTADIDVTVTVSEVGDFGASTGQRTVRITSGQTSQTFTVSTADDSTDESDGSITVSLASGSGYTGSGSATVAVADNDDPPQPIEQADPPVDGDLPDVATLTACEGEPELLIGSPTASRSDASVDFEVMLSCLPSGNPMILLVPVRDGIIGENLFISLTRDTPSATVTVDIGGEAALGLAIGWESGLAGRDVQGDVVFSD